MTNIAFIGRAGAGKTTASELLIKHFGYERLSFAAPLKVGVGSTSDRGLLQRVGVGVRELHPDFLVNLLIDDYFDRPSDVPITIDDARFDNEVTRLKIEGFVIVRVEADRGERLTRLRANGRLQDEAQLEHVSETELDAYIPDYLLDNNAGPERLLEGLTTILNAEQR